MTRYWRIYRTFVVSSLARELEFKANFFAKVLKNILWTTFFLMILFVVYRNTSSVAGWSRGDSFVLAATVFLMEAVTNALFFSLQEFPGQIRMGTMDFVVTKPVDSQFWVSFRRFNFDQIGTLFAGLLMVSVGVHLSGVHPDALQWIAFLTLFIASVVIFYTFNLALMTTSVWLVRVDNLWVLGESVTQIARFPLDIYGIGIQRFLTYFVPLAFLATMPARQLVKGADWTMVGLGVAWCLSALVATRLFWRYALRQYSSASS